MHAIGEARGGNDIRVSEFGSSQCEHGSCNLHSAWDSGLLDHRHVSEPEYVADIQNLISRRGLQHRANGSPEMWANESFHLAQKVWLRDGGSVDDVYFRNNIGRLNERLALAGLRLAALLNRALEK